MQGWRSKPNLWIAGLPKAGTSSLFSTLQGHPLITGTTPKESFYLLDQQSPLLNKQRNFWKNGVEGWRQFFPSDESGRTRFYLEGTTHLFFQDHSLEVVRKNHPGSKFIIMLREPSERIYSSFIYTRDTLLRMPGSISFERYVSDLHAGKGLEYIKDPISRYVLSNELLYSDYRHYLERWEGVFGRGSLFIGLFENFIESNQRFMQNLFEFLGLEGVEVPVTHNNPTRTFKQPALHRAVASLSKAIPQGSGVKEALKSFYFKTFSSKPPPITEGDLIARTELKKHFEPGSRPLKTAYGLDISTWYE